MKKYLASMIVGLAAACAVSLGYAQPSATADPPAVTAPADAPADSATPGVPEAGPIDSAATPPADEAATAPDSDDTSDTTIDAGPEQTAHQPPATSDEEALSVGKQSYKAVRDGDWKKFAAGLLILIGWALRRFGGFLPDWVRSHRGGVITIAVLSAAGALGHGWWAGVGWTNPDLWKTAGDILLYAMGGYIGLKRLVFPSKGPQPTKAG